MKSIHKNPQSQCVHNLTLSKKLKQVQNYLNNILAILPEQIYWIDENGTIIGCNEQQAKVFGFSSSEKLIGKNIYDVANVLGWNKSIPDDIHANDLSVMKNKQTVSTEEVILINNEKRIFLVHKNPLFDKGNVVGIIGISIDITDRKHAEQLEVEKQIEAEKLRLTEAFSATLAHDLRNPITGLKLCIEGIKAIFNKKDMDPKEKESLLADSFEKGIDTTNKALLFITMMLRKIGNIGKKVKKEDLDLCMIAEDVKDALATYCFNDIERTKVTWNKENAFVYHGNNLDTQHIVWNLVGNALKFIDQEERGHITISFEQDTDYNKLIVYDTAKGIEPQYMSIIFDAFITKDESGKGTGLGLSFCKSTMQNYGGDITCESKLGEYTKFVCTFPKVNMDEI